MYTYNEIGIDTEKFANDFNTSKVFATEELKEKYLEYLKLVSQTYWFISANGQALLDIPLDTPGLTYNSNTDMFYYEGSSYQRQPA